MHEKLSLLQTLRFKGRAQVGLVSAATGMSESEVRAHLRDLVADEYVLQNSDRYLLSPAGRELLNNLLNEERQALDGIAFGEAYERFVPINSEYKRLIHAWQVRDGSPNNHEDPGYDQDIVDRVTALHGRFETLLQTLIDQAPRLARYRQRFSTALEKVRMGDTAWLTRPLIDSHHTVWFELHEDLIGLAGHTRQAEAQAGRAD